MRKRFVAVSALLALLFTACNNSTTLYPVTGKVLVKGQPAVGATVTFLRKGRPEEQPYTASGEVDEGGTFTLAGPAGKGTLVGEYIVLVEWKEGAGKIPGRAPALSAPDRLEKRYLDSSKPLLSAVVEAKANILPSWELE